MCYQQADGPETYIRLVSYEKSRLMTISHRCHFGFVASDTLGITIIVNATKSKLGSSRRGRTSRSKDNEFSVSWGVVEHTWRAL